MAANSVFDFDAVSKALRICHITGTSVLQTPSRTLLIPFVLGRKGYYGEQLLSAMAKGSFKTYDYLGSRHLADWRNQGYDVDVVIPSGKYPRFLIEVKTLHQGKYYDMSPAQQRVANILAIYNPSSVNETIEFNSIVYIVPKKSFRFIKLQ